MSYLRIFQTEDSLLKAKARGERISQSNTIYTGGIYHYDIGPSVWDFKQTYYVLFDPCTWITVGVYKTKQELLNMTFDNKRDWLGKGEEGPYNWVEALIATYRNSLYYE